MKKLYFRRFTENNRLQKFKLECKLQNFRKYFILWQSIIGVAVNDQLCAAIALFSFSILRHPNPQTAFRFFSVFLSQLETIRNTLSDLHPVPLLVVFLRTCE